MLLCRLKCSFSITIDLNEGARVSDQGEIRAPTFAYFWKLVDNNNIVNETYEFKGDEYIPF